MKNLTLDVSPRFIEALASLAQCDCDALGECFYKYENDYGYLDHALTLLEDIRAVVDALIQTRPRPRKRKKAKK